MTAEYPEYVELPPEAIGLILDEHGLLRKHIIALSHFGEVPLFHLEVSPRLPFRVGQLVRCVPNVKLEGVIDQN